MSSSRRKDREVADPQRDDADPQRDDADPQRDDLELSVSGPAVNTNAPIFSLEDEEMWLHNHGVVALTLRLARAVGMKDDELIHVRRGAFLHDIGMVGVPDDIIFKPGQLTEKEWGVMRRHPVFARDLLSTTGALTPALDIPYCHHEKWDGTGYPRGLKGEQIPLAARVFAVVDVWCALRSDRPHRAAWSIEEAREYIFHHAGTHFDPRIVEAFLTMVAEEGS